jgi:hypothetical protein
MICFQKSQNGAISKRSDFAGEENENVLVSKPKRSIFGLNSKYFFFAAYI